MARANIAYASVPSASGLQSFELAVSKVTEHEVVSRVNRHLVPLFFCLGLVCYLDRTNLSFAAIQLSRDLGLSCSVYGLGAGLFFLGYCAGQVPSNMALARVGAPLWLSACVVVWGVVAASFSLVRGTASFLALRVALGLAECGTFPGMWLHLSLFYTPRELGQAYAKVCTSTVLAQVVGAPLAAGILSLDGALGLRGWQWLFLTEGLLTVLFGGMLFFLLAPSPAGARWLTPEQRTWLQRRQDAQPTARDAEGGLMAEVAALVGVLRNWRVWYLSAFDMNVSSASYGILFFTPLIVHNMFDGQQASAAPAAAAAATNTTPTPEALQQAQASCSGEGGPGSASGAAVVLLSMLPFAAAAVAMVLNAKHAEAVNERHRHVGIPLALAALLMALTPLMLRYVAPAAAFACLVLAVAAEYSATGPKNSWPAVVLQGCQAATGFAVMNSLSNLGGIVGPALLGVLADKFGGYAMALGVLAGLLSCSALGFLFFPEPAPDEPALAVKGGTDCGAVEAGETASTERQPFKAVPNH